MKHFALILLTIFSCFLPSWTTNATPTTFRSVINAKCDKIVSGGSTYFSPTDNSKDNGRIQCHVTCITKNDHQMVIYIFPKTKVEWNDKKHIVVKEGSSMISSFNRSVSFLVNHILEVSFTGVVQASAKVEYKDEMETYNWVDILAVPPPFISEDTTATVRLLVGKNKHPIVLHTKERAAWDYQGNQVYEVDANGKARWYTGCGCSSGRMFSLNLDMSLLIALLLFPFLFKKAK